MIKNLLEQTFIRRATTKKNFLLQNNWNEFHWNVHESKS